MSDPTLTEAVGRLTEVLPDDENGGRLTVVRRADLAVVLAAVERLGAAEMVIGLADRTMACLGEFDDAPEFCDALVDQLEAALAAWNNAATHDVGRADTTGEER